MHRIGLRRRGRRRELGVFRTHGFTPGRARATVAWQATTGRIVGVVAGVPVGLAIGRTAWQLLAGQTPMLHAAPFAALIVVSVVLGMPLLANVAALQRTEAELRRRTTQLQESRARLVSVADAERRRLERDLHDGAQQHLTAVSVKLRLAQSVALTAPDVAGPVLAEVLADLDAVKDQLRNLVHGIFPPQLTIGGLREALAMVAARAPLPIRVDLGELPRYAPHIEAAVYFCCLEAVHNASKHAGAGASVVVRLRHEPRELRFEVLDNGVGFVETGRAGRGQGVTNMADRLGAIGGDLTVTSTPGRGTTIAGRIPLSADPPPPSDRTTAASPRNASSSA